MPRASRRAQARTREHRKKGALQHWWTPADIVLRRAVGTSDVLVVPPNFVLRDFRKTSVVAANGANRATLSRRALPAGFGASSRVVSPAGVALSAPGATLWVVAGYLSRSKPL